MSKLIEATDVKKQVRARPVCESSLPARSESARYNGDPLVAFGLLAEGVALELALER